MTGFEILVAMLMTLAVPVVIAASRKPARVVIRSRRSAGQSAGAGR